SAEARRCPGSGARAVRQRGRHADHRLRRRGHPGPAAPHGEQRHRRGAPLPAWRDAPDYGAHRRHRAPDVACRAYHGGRALDRTGSVVALEPEADWTVYGFTGLVEDLDATWRAFVDRLVQPELSDEAVAGARRRLLTQARRRYTEPDQRLHVIAMRALFRDHPYALDPEGTEASLAALTAEDVRAYARDQLITSRMLLAVVGAVTRAHVESLVTATLGRLPRGDYRWTLPPAPRKHTPGWLIENRDLPTAYILGLFPGPPPTAGQAYWAFRVATAVLSGQIGYHIRAEHSLSYAAFAPKTSRRSCMRTWGTSTTPTWATRPECTGSGEPALRRFLVSRRPSAHTPSSIHTGGGTCGHCFAPPSSWLRAHRVMGRAPPRPPGRRTSMPGPGKAGRSGARRTPGRRGAS